MRGTIFLLIFLFLCGSLGDITTSEAQNASLTLDKTEVEVLKKIGSKLNVTFWDFNVDPCTASGNWMMKSTDGNDTMRSVTCGNCNSTTGVCHVIAIQLKSQNLTGVLPDELVNLTSITQIDFTRNHITGSLPTTWGSFRSLTILGLLGNQLSGRIPDQIGNIKTLSELVLENNRLEGSLPSSLGNLSNLTRLLLSANNFTGQLPEELGNLKKLEDLRIDGTAISGKIPSFFGNFTALTRLFMQGTSLEGPFPESFSSLKLQELRVTDINIGGTFPKWENMNFQYLSLRNCSLSGELPSFIGNMTNLKRLDLSFNNFTGEIPRNFINLDEHINNMYLTNNMLSGAIPSWIVRSKQLLDISYNSFNGSAPESCREGNVNMVASFSTSQSSPINPCLKKNYPCSSKAMNYNLFINCGGPQVTVGENEYESDTTQLGTSLYFPSLSLKWALSSTGDFVGGSNAKYTTTNVNTSLEGFYQTARLSPLSLRYYGLCMQNGNYNVNLHFAEIMFADDKTYLNNGRRIFDVSIQDKKVLQNFNIAQEANGTGRGIVKSFFADVNDNTLEIHFQWLGKGTNAIPERGVYGPLISAISVTPNFKPDLGENKGENKLSSGAIAGIVVGCCAFVLIILVLLFVFLRKKHDENKELKEELQLQTGYFSLKQIKSATQNFSPENKIGEGGFGPVYKGALPDGSLIAVKQLSAKSKQGNREFVNEIGMISALQHPNLVKLYGCCVEGNQLLLIYEYLENNSLARALFGPEGVRLNLDWQTRRKICMGIARGLAYLHEESVIKIVHRDIKATNVLLDKHLNAKISDFGLAKLDEEENTHISTRIAGTVGYMAPEYAMRGYLTDKADVYSFGIVVLELVSGKSNTNYRPKEEFVYLLDWAYVLQEQGNLLELVDPCLGSKYSKEEAEKMLNIALLCTSPSPTLRPSMSTMISMLEGQTPVTAATTRLKRTPSEVLRFKAIENLSHDSQVIGVSTDVPWTNSTVSSTTNRDESTSHLLAESELIDL